MLRKVLGRTLQVRKTFTDLCLSRSIHFYEKPCRSTQNVGFFVGSSCLLCLNSLGKLLALSLPNLSPLLDVECSFLMKDYRLGLRSCAICFKSRVLSYSKLWLKSVRFLYVVCCNSSQLPVVSRLKHVCKEQ